MKKKLIVFIISAIAINAGVLNITNPVLSSADELDSAKSELEEVLNEISNMEKESLQIQEDINNIYSTVQYLEENIVQLEEDNEIIKDEIEAVELEKGEKYEIIRDIIKIEYEQKSVGYLGLLLESKSFTNFLKRLEVVSNLIKNNNSLIDEMKELEKVLDEKKNILSNQIQEINSKKDKSEAELNRLEELVAQRDIEREKLLAVRDSLEVEIQEMQDKIDEEINKSTHSGEYLGGEFTWPVPGYFNISSPFGWRVDPISGESKFHRGIDIPAPAGTSVLAANAGTVIRSEYSASYGNLVVVDHGGGIVTYYSHNTSLLVSVGQVVEKGQIVATVGTTGYSTGNHLHFEVIDNGQPVDPMGYLN